LVSSTKTKKRVNCQINIMLFSSSYVFKMSKVMVINLVISTKNSIMDII
jgi:hypothetical protein